MELEPNPFHFYIFIVKYPLRKVCFTLALAKNGLKILRERSGLSQKALAEKLLVSRQTIISIEKGRYVPSLPLALKIAKVFDKKVEEVFNI